MIKVANKNELIFEGLRNAVTSFFSTMVGIEPDYKGTRESVDFSLSSEVAGIMCLSGDKPGMVACGVTEDLARTIIGGMTGVARRDLGDTDLSDGLAEVVNIISGSIKTRHPELGISLTPPISMRGSECVLCCKVDHASIILDFDVEGDDFTVVACL